MTEQEYYFDLNLKQILPQYLKPLEDKIVELTKRLEQVEIFQRTPLIPPLTTPILSEGKPVHSVWADEPNNFITSE